MAGSSFNKVKVPHGDNHGLWIDPQDTKRMIATNDGGVTVTLDGGKTWTPQDNQPTAQFYHVITDNATPYYVYGSQQDLARWRSPAAAMMWPIDRPTGTTWAEARLVISPRILPIPILSMPVTTRASSRASTSATGRQGTSRSSLK